MTTPAAQSSAPRMSDLSPTEVILLEEAGSVFGRLEREATLIGRALISDVERRAAEMELRMVRMEQAVAERLGKLQDGRDGKDGVDGRDGADGAVGPPGPPGEAIQGPPGADGRGWNNRGAYKDGETYATGDVVWRNLSPFLACNDDPGPCEEGNENWRLIVPKPSRGPQGRQGEPGRMGPAGPAGQHAPKVVGLNPLPGYMAQLVLEDGSLGEPFPVRAWLDEYHAETR